MEKEKLKDKITKINLIDNFSIDKLLLALFFITDLFFRQLSVFGLLIIMFFISKLTIKHKYSNIISLFYVIPMSHPGSAPGILHLSAAPGW